ncbi:hypothetical protein A5755_26460 [Mycolicibacterium fortuitum]|uniref:MoxR-like ATPase n=1 Tax=Mycolicibacterium lutetiense TaxID=1641992 RepID=A0ABS5A3F0_9MYCO|nr:MoxR-like ATPase [Mycolicibacterium lutetiense]OBB49391.1 hypothetical protein A5754_30295 [Mycolicibacterium fortuitum]OBB59107.1 hypothetical protein A5755_26460 [Mycolicibacterium fortuitum]OBF81406.1 hypothetical protein A5751_00815 [Mycolicibacterium fortuitum]
MAAQSATTAESSTRRRGQWRNRENRASPKYLAKRVSEADHEIVTQFADAHGVKVSELLAPYIDDLIRRARDHRESATARAS